MKKLIVLVGLPRSGKSTWARTQSGVMPIVNPDSIRMALHGQRFVPEAEDFVWATAKAMVRALFLAGHEAVVVDATNTTRSRRDFWKPVGKDEWHRSFRVFTTVAEVCKERAIITQQEDLLPVIDRMSASFQPIQSDEGEAVEVTT